MIIAGFPCQPFSQAGKGQGFDDDKNRGDLYKETLKIIKEISPEYVILENLKEFHQQFIYVLCLEFLLHSLK